MIHNKVGGNSEDFDLTVFQASRKETFDNHCETAVFPVLKQEYGDVLADYLTSISAFVPIPSFVFERGNRSVSSVKSMDASFLAETVSSFVGTTIIFKRLHIINKISSYKRGNTGF